MKRCFILILAAALCLSGCGKQEKEASAQIFAMDTVMEIAAFGPQTEEAVSETESQIQELEKQLSRTLPDSDVSRINRNGTTPTTGIAAGTWALLEAALEYGDATDGAFDITIAPVMDAWGFTGDSFRVPEQAELDALLRRVSSGEIQMQTFRANGVESGKISLGGNVFVLGTKPDGSDWRVGIKDPQNEEALAVILPLRDAYAITSGGYERYFEENGKTYHHIIDPATGYPADNGLLSVTVVAKANGPDASGAGNGAMCDAFSTALFVMGEEKALDFWRTGGYDFDLVLVTADGRVVVTAGLADRFEEVKDSGYTYETVS